VTNKESFRAGAENAEARSAETMSDGGSFQRVALETGKAWSLNLERRQRGATDWRRETERRLERAVVADVWMKVDRRYCGDVPCSERYTGRDFEADALKHLQLANEGRSGRR
jgi:hypothetical protein